MDALAVSLSEVELTSRQREILTAVCRDHLLTGRPVSSLQLCRMQGLRWSSATIRSELAELEALGLVMQPHAASGRVPTREALRRYVQDIASARGLGAPGLEPWRSDLIDTSSPQATVRSSAQVLSALSGCVAVGFVGAPRLDRVTSIRLSPLGETRGLATIVMEDGKAHTYPVELEVGQCSELAQVEARLSETILGRTLAEARDRLMARQLECERHADAALAAALRLGLALCASAWLDPLWIQVAGAPRLLRDGLVPGGGTSAPGLADLAKVFTALEDVQRLAALLCQLLPAQPDPQDLHVAVHVDVSLDPNHDSDALAVPHGAGPASNLGVAGSAHAASHRVGLSVVGCRLAAPACPPASDDNATATASTAGVALLGIGAMDYERLIPLVDSAARTLAVRPRETRAEHRPIDHSGRTSA